MARGKITHVADWEDRELIIRKSYGRLTIQEIMEYMQTREFLNEWEGTLFTWTFIPRSERYDDYAWEWSPEDGDAWCLSFAQDGDSCPTCGRTNLFPGYCPNCGTPLVQPREVRR